MTLLLAFFGFASWMEGCGIGMSILIATFVSTYSEHKNEASFQELQLKSSRIQAVVLRDTAATIAGLAHPLAFFFGPEDRRAPAPTSLSVEEVVVGDRVLLQAGDRVPADGVVLAGHVSVDQASLSGEKKPQKKYAHVTLANWAASYNATGVLPAGVLATPPASGDVRERLPPSTDAEKADFDHPHRVFRGSVVEEGEAVFIVDAVGTDTVFGKLAVEMSSEDKRVKPLQVKLGNLADLISVLANYGAAIICLSFLFKQFVIDNEWSLSKIILYTSNWQVCVRDVITSVMLAIIIIVVAVPEGLPMMIAMVLSLNMRKLLAEQVLVRRLLGIETAGCLNVLYVDKTGTLTQGVFQPDQFITGDQSQYRSFSSLPSLTRRLVSFVMRESATTASVDRATRDVVGGNATDRAVLRFLYPLTASSSSSSSFYPNANSVEEIAGVRVENEIIFSSTRKFSAAQVSTPTKNLVSFGLIPSAQPSPATSDFTPVTNVATAAADSRHHITLVKGAAERVLANCNYYYVESAAAGAGIVKLPLDEARRAALLAKVDKLSSDGARLVAVATSAKLLPDPAAAAVSSQSTSQATSSKKKKKSKKADADASDNSDDGDDDDAKEAEEMRQRELEEEEESAAGLLPRGMTLVGILSVTDTVRPNSRSAVISAQQAGVQVIMITGDRTETAVAVARQCNLLSADYVYNPPITPSSNSFNSSTSSSPSPSPSLDGSTSSSVDVAAETASLRAWVRHQREVVLTSAQLHLLTAADVVELLPRLRIVARALPSDKSKLVSLTQAAHALPADADATFGSLNTANLIASSGGHRGEIALEMKSMSGSSSSFSSSSSAGDDSSSDADGGRASVKRRSPTPSNLPLLSRSPSNKVSAPAMSSFDALVGAPRAPGTVCVVGMTGDGVNDSAALKKSDVSFSMGSGSEVAKEASDIVILDDNFQSIVNAVLYGRTIFKSIRKFIVFQCTMNLGTSIIVFLGPFAGFDFPLTLVQLLWVNLIMDTFAALAFGGEPALRRYLQERPVRREASIVNSAMLRSMIWNGVYIALTSMIFLSADWIQTLFSREVSSSVLSQVAGIVSDSAAHETHGELTEQGGIVFLTAFFSYFVFVCTIHAFNVRTHTRDLRQNLAQNSGFIMIIALILCLQIVFTELPFAASVLRTVPLTWNEWAAVFGMALLIIPFDLARKTWFQLPEDAGDHESPNTDTDGPVKRFFRHVYENYLAPKEDADGERDD